MVSGGEGRDAMQEIRRKNVAETGKEPRAGDAREENCWMGTYRVKYSRLSEATATQDCKDLQ